MTYIGADLMPGAIDDWIAAGIVELEAFLLRRAHFDDYYHRTRSEDS